jgi:CheY-like chemotaxis protein
MIYLIDDNKKRQQDSGWNDDKFQIYKDFIYPIYRLYEVSDDLKNEIFKNENNVILFHESFFENIENRQNKDVNEIRNKLEKLSSSSTNLYYVIFSGSNSERKINENNTSASIPVYVLYNNLEVFTQKYQHSNEYNLKYLLFGINTEIEPLLLGELSKAKRLFIEENLNTTCELTDYFFFRSKLDVNPNIKNQATIFNKDSEFGLHQKITENLSNIEFKGIFIPLCFGNTLSDYNGLRFATEIRCTNTINQCTPIFIYCFVGLEYLLQNEYFNILKTKNVILINYSKKAFYDVENLKVIPLKQYNLTNEICKLNIQPPRNYIDNHSIANEWAIYRWAKIISCDKSEELIEVYKNVEANLYFKYIRTINPILKVEKISTEELKINHKGNAKVLLIDDEAEKGWDKIFAYLLCDISKINVDYLRYDFKNYTSEEIIEYSINQIIKDEIDVVILDFRLNLTDFDKKNLKEITSIQLLKKIKDINPGIQVISFSATNKLWNLQALQDAGVDEFIFKDGGENCRESIQSLLHILEICLNKAIWLKQIHENFMKIKENFTINDITFKNSLKSNLDVSFELLEKSFLTPKFLNYAYLQLFLCIEDFLRLKSIFEFGDKCYVNGNIITLKKNNKKTWVSILKYNPKTKHDPSFFTYQENEIKQTSITTDFKMACVLIFIFNCHDSNVFNWPNIRDVRNKKAAHPENGNISQNEINDVLSFMVKILNTSNFQNPIRKGLDDLIDDNTLNELK